jgi:hypothetical protein
MPDIVNLPVVTTHTGEAAPNDCQYYEVSMLNEHLTKLIAKYDDADEQLTRLSELCYTPEFKATLANEELSEEERQARMLKREAEIGFDDGASVPVDLAYTEVLAFADEILKLNSTAPPVLALKARACLWEKSVEQMRDEDCVLAAEFLAQLAAL